MTQDTRFGWEQKLEKLRTIGEVELRMTQPGAWVASWRSVWHWQDGNVKAMAGRGRSPAGAVNDLWYAATRDFPKGDLIMDWTNTYYRWDARLKDWKEAEPWGTS